MNNSNLSRKLAVILHADVVASTTLVQRNETLAHERMQAAFHQFASTIADYGGIAHELRGDALVAEFERASDAVTASLAFQLQNTALNATHGDDIRPELRIGISLGEVVIADGTITGAGVVLAQRLEQLAEPGGIVVQGAVSETVPTIHKKGPAKEAGKAVSLCEPSGGVRKALVADTKWTGALRAEDAVSGWNLSLIHISEPTRPY